MYCPNCGQSIGDDVKFCPECGASISGGSGPSASIDSAALMLYNKKSEALSIILSLLIPGLGHLYVGQTNKGIGLLVGAIVCGFLSVLLLFPLIIYVAIWIYGMYDSYKLTREYNRYLLENKGQPPW